MKKKVLIWLIPFIFSGCVSAPPFDPLELDLPLAPQWTSAADSSGVNAAVWWRDFHDSRLDSLIIVGLAKNYNLQSAAATVEMAVATARIAGADGWPQMSAGGSASKSKTNFVGMPFGGSGAGVVTSETEKYGLALNVSWELDLWGRIRAGQAAASADVEAARADLAGAQNSIAGQIAKLWYSAIEAEQQVNLSAATVESYQTSFDQIKSRYEKGLRSSLELRLAESNLATARAGLARRENQLQQIKRQLQVLLGEYPSAAIVLDSPIPRVLKPIPAGLPADILRQRPDLVAAERRLAAAGQRVRQARRSLLPRISLTGSTGTATDELSELLNGDYSIWNLVGNLTQPLFQGGRLLANVTLNQARADNSLAQYALTALKALAEVEGLLTGEELLAKQELAIQLAADQASAAKELAENRYANGLINYISLLESQRAAFNAHSQLLTIRRQRVDNRIDLYLALGGGFSQNLLTEYQSEVITK